MQQNLSEEAGHVLVVGNPWPNRISSLPSAEQEAMSVADTMSSAGMEVRTLRQKAATKARVKQSLQNASWVHFACHGDVDNDSLVLAAPHGISPGCEHLVDLSIEEVPGSMSQEGVKIGNGATAVLSACNTGRGKIKAEGFVGLARGFLAAGASATVVTLWSVDDGSTEALMKHFYKHLVSGVIVARAL